MLNLSISRHLLYISRHLLLAGTTIFSEEGTTQGDPLAMPMFALGVLPLIDCISGDLMQVWYADDATACGSLSEIRLWWDKLLQSGPIYFPNPSKTCIAGMSLYCRQTQS